MSQDPMHDQPAVTSKLPALRDRNRPLFSLGQIVATAGVHQDLVRHGIDSTPYIRKHHCGLWGDEPPEDAQENDFSVLNLVSKAIAGHAVQLIAHLIGIRNDYRSFYLQ